MIIAYIDAGTGAMLLQWIIALFIGAGLFFRTTVADFFRRLFRRKRDLSVTEETTARSGHDLEDKDV